MQNDDLSAKIWTLDQFIGWSNGQRPGHVIDGRPLDQNLDRRDTLIGFVWPTHSN